MKAITAGCLCAVLIVAVPALAGDWQLAREGEGIRVFTREVAGSDYRAFRGEAVVDAELNSLMALLDDTAACPQWMYNCKHPKLLAKPSLLERYQYMVNDFPWPASDRDMIVKTTIAQDAATRITTVSLQGVAPQALPDAARAQLPDSKHVHVRQLQGFFELTPLDGERTRVVYQLHLEPVGSLPAAVINAMIVDTPFETLRGMRELAGSDKYRCFRPF